MKIDTLATSVIQPVRRKKKRSPKIPPWASEIPPDKVEILLRARVNRYSRSKLRYNHFGSTRTKYRQRMAIYQDLLDILPDHVLTVEEMVAELARLRAESEGQEQMDLETTSNVKSNTEIDTDNDENENQAVDLDEITDLDFEFLEDEQNYKDGDFSLDSMIKNALANS